jgi:hypothetical protein
MVGKAKLCYASRQRLNLGGLRKQKLGFHPHNILLWIWAILLGNYSPCVRSMIWLMWTVPHLFLCFCDVYWQEEKVLGCYPSGRKCFVIENMSAYSLLARMSGSAFPNNKGCWKLGSLWLE